MASITIWTRLESLPGASPLTDANGNAPDPYARSLQAQVRDPLWFLARQWQTGEFLGDDGGSAVQAAIHTRSVPLTSFRPGEAGTATAYDPAAGAPLEVTVEAEAPGLDLRHSIQLGLRLRALLDDAGLSARYADFLAVSAYEIDATQPPTEIEAADAARLRQAMNGRVIDGRALLAAAHAATDLADVPPLDTMSAQDAAAVKPVLQELVDWVTALYVAGGAEHSWEDASLRYHFAVGSESVDGDIDLEAGDFPGGHLDWYSFSLGSGQVGSGTPSQASDAEWTFLPNHVSFTGMPGNRFWSFEDSRTDFGRTDVQKVDLAKLLVLNFALVSGDEWFALPLPLDVGTLSTVRLLLVTDTFGVRTVVRSTTEQVPAQGRPWSMFTLAAPDGSESNALLLAPTLTGVLEGADLEEVAFLRDEMADMAWAVERRLQSPLDEPLDGYARWRAALPAQPDDPPTPPLPGDPEVAYLAGTVVPDNWIPMVPVANGPRSFMFQRGVMEAPDSSGTLHEVPPRGRVLRPGQPLYLNDEAIPRAGIKVVRRMRRTRSADGSTYVWMARTSSAGRGEGSSGLQWDVVHSLSVPTSSG